ncbi:nucleoside phosphorylase domain-containing protein [Entophlyctis helioformis]|nr:nucleoside phosphorylase domain-containing protein [Entophlyctis helioformis]
MTAITNANFPVDAEGATYHVGVTLGQVANRIVTVGDPHRANKLAAHLDAVTFRHESKRGFTTITGTLHGVPLSIIAIGMGTPMADMMVREVRAMVEGPMLMARFGSCGGIGSRSSVGLISVAKDGAAMVSRNYDYFEPMYAGRAPEPSAAMAPYTISQLCPADAELSDAIIQNLSKHLGPDAVISGANATADSFYSSQGRLDPSLLDHNQDLIDTIRKRYPNCETLEMETFTLLHLARCCTYRAAQADAHAAAESTNGNSRHGGSVRAAACAMIFADRATGGFITPEQIEKIESTAGLAIMEAVVGCSL